LGDPDHSGAELAAAAHICRGQADLGMVGVALGDQLLGHVLHLVGTDRETQPDVARLRVGRGRQRRDRGSNADQLTGSVHQRTPRVARVDRCVGLNRRGHHQFALLRGRGVGYCSGGHRTVEGRDDARSHGVVETQRVPDGHHRITHLNRTQIGEPHDLQISREFVQLDHGKVGGGVGAHDRRRVCDVAEHHTDAGPCAAGRHHVVVRHNVARGVDDDPRTLTAGPVAADYLDRHHSPGGRICHSRPVWIGRICLHHFGLCDWCRGAELTDGVPRRTATGRSG